MRAPRTRLLLVSVALALVGCQFFSQLFALQKGMRKRYHVAPASINVSSGTHGTVMTVLFNDPAHSALPDSQRAAFARDVAEYIRDHYPPYSTVGTISVGFTGTQRYGITTFTRSQVPYTFTRDELGPPQDTLKERPTF